MRTSKTILTLASGIVNILLANSIQIYNVTPLLSAKTLEYRWKHVRKNNRSDPAKPVVEAPPAMIEYIRWLRRHSAASK